MDEDLHHFKCVFEWEGVRKCLDFPVENNIFIEFFGLCLQINSIRHKVNTLAFNTIFGIKTSLFSIYKKQIKIEFKLS